MSQTTIKSGIEPLESVVQGLRLGDNVVWQVDFLEDYSYFAEPFANQALRDGRTCIYLRFAPHPPILSPREGLKTIELHPQDRCQ
jgi:pyruvate,water dikinase